MSHWPEIVLMASGAILAAFFAGAETGAYVLDRLRLRYRAGSGLRRAVVLERLLDGLSGFVTAMLIWTNLSVYLVSAACTALFERIETAVDPELAATLAAAPLLFVFSELAPKDLFRRRPEGLMLSSARVLYVAERLVRPAARAFAGLGKAVRKALRLREEDNWALVSRRALRQQFAEGAARGVFSGPQKLLVENILQAASRPVAGAARPIDEYPAFPADATARELVSRAGDLPSCRVPVFEGDPHRVTGVVHVLKAWGGDPEAKLREFALPPVWLDGNASVIQALAWLRRANATVGFLAGDGRAETSAQDAGPDLRAGTSAQGAGPDLRAGTSAPHTGPDLRAGTSAPHTGPDLRAGTSAPHTGPDLRARGVVTVEGLLRHMIAGGG